MLRRCRRGGELTFRSLLADDVSFRGPLGTTDDADGCVEGIKGMSKIVTDIVIHHTWSDGPTC